MIVLFALLFACEPGSVAVPEDTDTDTDTDIRAAPYKDCTPGDEVSVDGYRFLIRLPGVSIIGRRPHLGPDGFDPFTAYTCGWPELLRLNIYPTGGTVRHHEEHVIPIDELLPTDADTPRIVRLALDLPHVDEPTEGATVYTEEHREQLTFALRVYDAEGLADCVVWGDDPSSPFRGNGASQATDGDEVIGANCQDWSR